MKRPARRPDPPASPPAPATALLAMEEAIALLKTSRPTFYRWLRAGRFKGLKVGRQWRFHREDIERFLHGEQPRIELPVTPEPLVGTLETELHNRGALRLPPRTGDPLNYAAHFLARLAFQSGASDIHVGPEQTADRSHGAALVRLRIDGVLHALATFDGRLLPALIGQWKMLAACDPREKEKPQDGRILFTAEELGLAHPLDVRVCFVPTVLGEAVTARLLPRVEMEFALAKLDYSPRDQERLHRWLTAPWGMILVTGPTGAGKTTALYSCLMQLNRSAMKVIAIEDPVEYVLPDVQQIQVNVRAGLTFAAALRAVLRSDPDVIMVGEIRDRETLEICFKTALTGHLVLSTLNTEDAASALTRMVEASGADPFMVADTTRLVLAQRLVRRVCPDCSVAEPLAAGRLDFLRRLASEGGREWNGLPQRFRRAVGCAKCAGTGYRGRTVIAETLEVTPEIGQALRRGAPTAELAKIAISQGMTTLAADGIAKAAQGVTTVDEVLRARGLRLP